MKLGLRIILIVWCALLGCGASEALAQDVAAAGGYPAIREFILQSQAKQAPEDFTREVARDAIALEKRDIPADAYLNKANEGLAKGIPPERIAPALKQTRDRLERADRLAGRLGPNAKVSPAERRALVTEYQAALLSGVPDSRLETIGDRYRDASATQQRDLIRTIHDQTVGGGKNSFTDQVPEGSNPLPGKHEPKSAPSNPTEKSKASSEKKIKPIFKEYVKKNSKDSPRGKEKKASQSGPKSSHEGGKSHGKSKGKNH